MHCKGIKQTVWNSKIYIADRPVQTRAILLLIEGGYLSIRKQSEGIVRIHEAEDGIGTAARKITKAPEIAVQRGEKGIGITLDHAPLITPKEKLDLPRGKNLGAVRAVRNLM